MSKINFHSDSTMTIKEKLIVNQIAFLTSEDLVTKELYKLGGICVIPSRKRLYYT